MRLRPLTEYPYINGKQYYDTEYFEAKGQDIINVFSGKSPSHDLRIVFGALILLCDNDKILQLNGRFYKIDDYGFNILKTKYKFSRASIKEKVRFCVPYEIPAFSVIITKEGTLKDFEYGSINMWIKPISHSIN